MKYHHVDPMKQVFKDAVHVMFSLWGEIEPGTDVDRSSYEDQRPESYQGRRKGMSGGSGASLGKFSGLVSLNHDFLASGTI